MIISNKVSMLGTSATGKIMPPVDSLVAFIDNLYAVGPTNIGSLKHFTKLRVTRCKISCSASVCNCTAC